MRLLQRVQVLVGVTLLTLGQASAQQAVPMPTPRPQPPMFTPIKVTHGHVFLLRGLANVFSLGMDQTARKLKAKGIPVDVTNYTHWHEFAVVLISEYKSDPSVVPVVIIGHSLGADAAVLMGNELAEGGVPVRLVVAFDGVKGGVPVVKGVQEVVNYYKPNGFGKAVPSSEGFSGTVNNIDLSNRKEIDHVNIDKTKSLQDEVVTKVVEVFTEATKSN